MTTEIILSFFFTRDNIKIYHWNTKNYSKHESTGKYVEFLNNQIDVFVESMLKDKRPRIEPNSCIELKVLNDKSIIPFVKDFRNWLYTIEEYGDIIPLITETDKLLYLLTFQN
jgi:hypothetical protein